MIFRMEKKAGECEYEEWSKKEKKLKGCGEHTHIKAGPRYVCRDHLPFALAMDKKADTRGRKDKEITNADFMMYVDGCTKEYHQSNLL